MAIRQVSVFLENRPGKLAETLKTLSDAKVELRALSIADTTDFGILRFISDDNRKAAYALSEKGHICSVTDVVAACADDKPGGMATIIEILAAANINVEYVYAFVAPNKDHAWVVLRVNDNEKAEKTLTDAGVTLLTSEDVADI